MKTAEDDKEFAVRLHKHEKYNQGFIALGCPLIKEHRVLVAGLVRDAHQQQHAAARLDVLFRRVRLATSQIGKHDRRICQTLRPGFLKKPKPVPILGTR